jgi:hypothetical protein
MRQFESREEATAWLLALPAAVQLGGQCRLDNEGVGSAVLRWADRLTDEWRARGGNAATTKIQRAVDSNIGITPDET